MRNKLLKIICAIAFLALSKSALAYQQCFNNVAAYYGVSPDVLRVFARIETSNRPYIVTKNTNGTKDIGLMGINTIWLKELSKFGVTESSLLDPCTNIAASGYILGKLVRKHGYSWEAIGRYHSGTPKHKIRYIRKVLSELKAMGVIDGKKS